MRRLLRWAGAALGGVAVYRLLRDRRTAPAAEAPPADARAAELRRKLEESRAIVGEREVFEERETTVEHADPAGDPDERRRLVHDRGRAVSEQMKGEPRAE